MNRKVCVVTGTRAEYGLLYWLMKDIESDPELKLQVVVTGMHLSPEFGLTYKEVERSFSISKKVEVILSSDTAIGISKSVGLAQISFGEVFDDLEPDIIILLGDRYEIFAAGVAAMIARIPVAHIHGGELTEGLIDDAIRHSLTKMSQIHFTATEEYRNRVIQLGEQPQTVINVGGLGAENISRLNLLSRAEVETALGTNLLIKNILVTYHPVTLEVETARSQFQELLNVLEDMDETLIIFTKANSDTDGRVINAMIDDYVKRKNNAIAFTSLGQLRYLSVMKYMDAVVGNSSSGLLEAPSFGVPTINIGDRQRGRVKAASVIDSMPLAESITQAFQKLYSKEFQVQLKDVKNPYDAGGATQKIIETLKKVNTEAIIKKVFFDMEH